MKSSLVAVLAWKPYNSIEETKLVINQLDTKSIIADHQYYLALPYHYLSEIGPEITSSTLILGSNDMNSVMDHSFTQPIAAEMLKKAGAQFVLLGTYDSRQLGQNDEAAIHAKILQSLKLDIPPVVCIGENVQEYQNGQSKEVLERQLAPLKELTAENWKKIRIIYEAPWMNETASLPTLEDIQKAYQLCQEVIKELFGSELSGESPLYCAVPDDSIDLSPAIEKISCPGFYIAHATLHLETLSQDLHFSLPLHAEENQKNESDEAKIAATVVGEAVLNAAHELEKGEETVEKQSLQEKQSEEKEIEEEESEFEDFETSIDEETEEDEIEEETNEK